MKTGELKAKSLAQLRDYAFELDVVGRSRMSKEELIDAILGAKAREAKRHERGAAGRAAVAARPSGRQKQLDRSAPAAKAASKSATTKSSVAKLPERASSSKKSTGGTSSKPAASKAEAKVTAKAVAKPEAKKTAPLAAKLKQSPPAPSTKSPSVKALVQSAAKSSAAKPVASKPIAARFTLAKSSAKLPVPATRTKPEVKAPPKPSSKSKAVDVKSVSAPISARARAIARSLDGAAAPAPLPAAKPARRAAPTRPPRLIAPIVARRGKLKPAPVVAKEATERSLIASAPAKESAPPEPRIRRRSVKGFRLSPAAPPLNMRAGGFTVEFEVPRARESAPPLAALPAPESAPPQTYGEDRLVLLPRDPEWLYCYWELSQAAMGTIGEALARFGGQFALRVHNVTGTVEGSKESHEHRDIDLPVQAHGHWYCQALGGNLEHVVEIGLRQPDGQFLALARSNRVRTPRAAARPAPAHTRAAAAESASGDGTSEWMEPMALEGPSHPSSPVGQAGPGGPGGPGGAGGPEAAPSSPISGFLPTSPAGPHGLQRPSPPAAPAGRDFWLAVDCELIVYGATEPDALVKLQGQTISLRPDGTFSARFALPDGRQIIPVEATSADGVDCLEIVPTVQRQTRASRS